MLNHSIEGYAVVKVVEGGQKQITDNHCLNDMQGSVNPDVKLRTYLAVEIIFVRLGHFSAEGKVTN